MTEATYTLEQAKVLLQRQQCEEDMTGQGKRGPFTHPLGHPLVKVLHGHTRMLVHYRCERCGARFVEAENDCQ